MTLMEVVLLAVAGILVISLVAAIRKEPESRDMLQLMIEMAELLERLAKGAASSAGRGRSRPARNATE